MSRHEGVRIALRWLGETGQAAVLPQMRKIRLASGQQLMHIRLMPNIKNQAVYDAAGVVVMFLVSKINYQTFRLLSVPGIVAAILLLVLALSPLGVELNEVKRWVRIGPIQFQPSEVAKVAVILFFATRLSKRDTEKKKKWSRRTLTGRTLERLDRIGFLEQVP